MAVLAYSAARLVAGARPYPIDDGGKQRVQWGKCAVDTQGDAGSTFTFFRLPPGRVRILLPFIRVGCSAFGASRVLKLGHRAYAKASHPTYTTEAEDDDAFFTGLDISGAAVSLTPTALGTKFDVYSQQGVEVFGTVTGGTSPANATLEVLMPYVAD